MKPTLLLFLLLFSATLYAPAQTLTAEQKDVQQTVTKMLEGFADLNIQEIKYRCTPDFRILESGEIWNADTVNGLTKEFEKATTNGFNRTNTLTFYATEVYDNTAFTYYHHHAVILYNDDKSKTRDWLESAFLIKTDKGWRIKILHSTLIPSEGK